MLDDVTGTTAEYWHLFAKYGIIYVSDLLKKVVAHQRGIPIPENKCRRLSMTR